MILNNQFNMCERVENTIRLLSIRKRGISDCMHNFDIKILL